MIILKAFRLALSFLTRIPVGRQGMIGEREWRWMACGFPFCGYVLAALALLLPAAVLKPDGQSALFSLLVACMTVSLLAYLTRGLHLDGMADMCDAVALLNRLPAELSAARNARAVCHLLNGGYQAAIDLLRPLVFPQDGLMMSTDADPSWCANFALALLRRGSEAGFRTAVAQLAPPDHPAVRQLRALVDAATPRRTGFGRLTSLFAGPPPIIVPADFPVGWPEIWLVESQGTSSTVAAPAGLREKVDSGDSTTERR